MSDDPAVLDPFKEPVAYKAATIFAVATIGISTFFSACASQCSSNSVSVTTDFDVDSFARAFAAATEGTPLETEPVIPAKEIPRDFVLFPGTTDIIARQVSVTGEDGQRRTEIQYYETDEATITPGKIPGMVTLTLKPIKSYQMNYRIIERCQQLETVSDMIKNDPSAIHSLRCIRGIDWRNATPIEKDVYDRITVRALELDIEEAGAVAVVLNCDQWRAVFEPERQKQLTSYEILNSLN